jgi:amidohydrolase
MMDYMNEAYRLFDYTRALRRDFHMYPEIGFQEVRTAGIVAKELNNLGLEVSTGIAETGIVALIEGNKPGPVVLLRFDMDALPIQEQTGAEYASQNPGVMHACGHDAHTAVGLTVARILAEQSEKFAGTVKLVFQPAEEGLGGAEMMVMEGVLKNPAPDISLALHVWNDKPVGWVGISPGPVLAASETFEVTVEGKGGHGAAPHVAVDPVLASANIINALQSIVSRNVPPLETAVVSVTTVQAGTAHNIIPPKVDMKGTIRSFSPDVRGNVIKRFHEITETVANAMGCESQVDIQSITPAVVNDPEVTARVQKISKSILPEEDDIDTDFRTMGSEDMAFMMQDIPGCYFCIGSANGQLGFDAPHHHPEFDIDEEALPKAAGLMASVAASLLNN